MINSFNYYTSTISIFRQSIISFVTHQQHRIILITSLVFSCLAAYYIMHRCYRAKPLPNGQEINPAHSQGEFNMALMNTSQRVILVANKAIFMKHYTGKGHPEAPKRVEAIEEALVSAHLMEPNNTVLPRQAKLEEVSLCHAQTYQQEVQKQIKDLADHQIECDAFNKADYKVDHVPGDFNISPDTWETSLYAAGASLTAIEYILDENNQTSRAFCIVRPPGHHAHQHTGSGFCVFNNVAIAAKHLTQNLGFQRVLIVDWDAHHGDGTQTLTEGDKKIFYFSTHKDTAVGRGFYPGAHWGHKTQQGVDEGKGTVLNCPVSGTKEECRAEILKAFRTQLIPAMDKYQPDFVLISCGFDAHENDSLVGLGLKDEDYKEMTQICISIAEKHAKGRIVSVLEGGYNLEAIAGAAKVHVETLKHSFINEK